MRHTLAVAVAVLAAAAAPAQTTTHRFDLPTAPLSIFGVRFTADHLGPPMATITAARANLTYTTTSLDAANLVLELQAPSAGVPTWRLRGRDLGWSGTGTFTAQLTTSLLNGPIDLGYPVPTASLFSITLYTEPFGPLGGQFTASHFEVDVVPWTDLGGGVAGGAPPALQGAGALTAGAPVTVSLAGAPPGALTGLILGAPRVDLPLFGGTLVPAPQQVIPAVTTPAGTLDLGFTWPAGVSPGTTLFLQTWSIDLTAPQGLAASNGLGVITS